MKFCTLPLLFFYSLLAAQSFYPQQKTIGDTLPLIQLAAPINAVSAPFILNGKGKLTILDFWNTRCSGTYSHFTKIKSLVNKFGPRLQIILVNKEDAQTTKEFFLKNRELLPPVPVIAADSLLSALFPFHSARQVWIDSNAIVRFITHSWNLTAANIQRMLNGEQLNLSQLHYFEHPVVDGLFSVTDSTVRKQLRFNYYSVIGPCIPGLDIGSGVVNTNGKMGNENRITQSCVTPVELLILAFSENGKYNLASPATIIFEGLDSSDFISPPETSDKFDQWYQNHFYNYDLLIPEESSAQLYSIMQQDLSRFFKVKASVEKRWVNSWVLTIATANHKPKHADEILPEHSSLADSFFYYRNTMLKDLVNNQSQTFALHGFNKPLVDGTGYRVAVNLKIPKSVWRQLTVQGLNHALEHYGLKIVQKPWLVNVLVVKRELVKQE